MKLVSKARETKFTFVCSECGESNVRWVTKLPEALEGDGIIISCSCGAAFRVSQKEIDNGTSDREYNIRG